MVLRPRVSEVLRQLRDLPDDLSDADLENDADYADWCLVVSWCVLSKNECKEYVVKGLWVGYCPKNNVSQKVFEPDAVFAI
jgi:hypothetical protein